MTRNRPTWDQLFAKICMEVAEKSSCARIKVGSVLVRDNRIISIGYNGSAPGQIHCISHWEKYYEEYASDKYATFESFASSEEFYKLHHEWSEPREIHAEQNALIYAAKSGIATDGAIIYTVYGSCIHCAKIISQAGVREVKYIKEYDRESIGIEFLESLKIKCTKIKI